MAELGSNARTARGSVPDEADLERRYDAVKAERGCPDNVFANAGAGSPVKLGQITAKHIDEVFDANVKCTIFNLQKVLTPMRECSSIILTGSRAGTTGALGFTVYSASISAGRNLAQTWVEDLKGTSIRVNVQSPEATATELTREALGEEGQKACGAMTPLQRMQRPLPFPHLTTAASWQQVKLPSTTASRSSEIQFGPVRSWDAPPHSAHYV